MSKSTPADNTLPAIAEILLNSVEEGNIPAIEALRLFSAIEFANRPKEGLTTNETVCHGFKSIEG